MVFFTCNHCGESLKKAAVEKHYSFKSCRNAPIFLTCVDCLKDFREKEYVAHTKCLTEAERYSAKGFVAKPEKNKGAQKQEIWTECIQELAERPNFDRTTKNVLERIATQSNVPRKKPKFINFLKSSMRYSPNQAEKIWTIIEDGLEEFKKKSAPATSTSPSQPEPSVADIDESTNETKESASESEKVTGSVSIESVILHALAKSDIEKSTKKVLKKLQKSTDIPLNVKSPKKKKFINFLQKQFELDENNSNAVWECLSQSIQSLSSESNGISNGVNAGKKRKNPNDTNDVTTSKKPKTDTEVSLADSTTDAQGESTFDWQKHILRIFNKNQSNNKLPIDALKSKVIKKFLKATGDDEPNNVKYDKKFKKNMKKINQLSIINGFVQLNA
ncbi:cell growth-regulating nucleolar protein [Contarinia nasturtii]|uniref:cell growth-regulating nucleolar protein n=1 Tax=Contarinia nasturtii TaxID=265458 RepID=UPI0012D3983E|nr:cell growth-regulating nucleolar protein [Contarinia nasturtii]